MLGSHQAAEDALQEALLRAWRGLPSFEGRGSVRSWLYRIATNAALDAMKNRDGKVEHPNAKLDWVAYIGGPRESRRIVGDVMLTSDDIVSKKEFPDGCVPSTSVEKLPLSVPA